MNFGQYTTTEKNSVVLYWLKISEFSMNLRDSLIQSVDFWRSDWSFVIEDTYLSATVAAIEK